MEEGEGLVSRLTFFFFLFFCTKPKINEGSSELNNEFVQADMMIKEEKT